MADELPRSRRGDIQTNPVTGERSLVLVGTGDGMGDRLAAEVRVRPGGAVAGEHYHPSLTERFRVLAGTLHVKLDGEVTAAGPGADLTIEPGVLHDWWNAGEDEARVLVDVTPGRRFELMVSTIWGLGRDGKTNAKGMPGPLQLAVIGAEFDDVIRFTKPPELVQKVLFKPLAALGRTRGYRPYYGRYLEPQGHGEPDPELLALV